ncbi:hypothetical protein BJX61DRAFT_439528 [Aspergillus egyptiacus]|nr:hypothetical protein BJX61DRAFT_439528 [Aspergillus egyptiacus]
MSSHHFSSSHALEPNVQFWRVSRYLKWYKTAIPPSSPPLYFHLPSFIFLLSGEGLGLSAHCICTYVLRTASATSISSGVPVTEFLGRVKRGKGRDTGIGLTRAFPFSHSDAPACACACGSLCFCWVGWGWVSWVCAGLSLSTGRSHGCNKRIPACTCLEGPYSTHVMVLNNGISIPSTYYIPTCLSPPSYIAYLSSYLRPVSRACSKTRAWRSISTRRLFPCMSIMFSPTPGARGPEDLKKKIHIHLRS